MQSLDNEARFDCILFFLQLKFDFFTIKSNFSKLYERQSIFTRRIAIFANNTKNF